MGAPYHPGRACYHRAVLDLDFVRAAFPALEGGWAHLDNAGGTAAPRAVIERLQAAAAGSPMLARGGPHRSSREAGESYAAGHAAAAALLGGDPDEVILGTSTTANLDLLARALRPAWSAGDEVIVTDLDHEANIGPWRRLAATGIDVREWRARPESATLELDDLLPLLGPRTRLVAFTHCANVVGAIHEVAAITRAIHDAGALACVDGVALAPHRAVDVRALGADFYAVSLYKIFGPHLGALYGRRELLEGASPPTHDFLAAASPPLRYEPGGAPPELVAAVGGILDYLDALDQHTFALRGDAGEAPRGRIFAAIADHEAALCARLLDGLRASPRVRVVGPASADPERRIALVTFTIDGVPSAEVAAHLADAGVALRSGHFYAPRAIAALGLDPAAGGLVRVSLAHYNSEEEIDRALAALAPLVDRAPRST
ncbi:MAG: cysteine desulfurase-like protein [Myxococcales bacterium]|nr:cysteine desulfurase-like protein [Myxococcales bacterium]